MNAKRNEYIQALRGFFALTVYIWHAHDYIDDYLPFEITSYFKGFLANTFFFFLAAYFIGVSFTYNKKITTFEFVKKKIIKIYPLYSITTLFMALEEIIYDGAIRKVLVSELIPHILLIRSWIPNYMYDGYLNGPGWFLSSLLFYWIITKRLLNYVKSVKEKSRSLHGLFLCYLVYYVLTMRIRGNLYIHYFL